MLYYFITHALGLSTLKTLSSHPTLSNKTVFQTKLLAHGSDCQNRDNKEEIFGGVSIDKRIVAEGIVARIYREIRWLP